MRVGTNSKEAEVSMMIMSPLMRKTMNRMMLIKEIFQTRNQNPKPLESN